MQENIANQNFIEEDEIDLKELFSTIWKNKFKIVIFSFIITSLTIVYTLSIPNSYKSETKLIPQTTQSKSSLGGLGSLAGMANIDLGVDGEVDATTSFNTILNDYNFEKYIIKKYNLIEKLKPNKEHLVFALGYDGIYNIFHKKEDNKEDQKSLDEQMFDAYKTLTLMISIASDKKTSLITLSVTSQDRFLAKKLVNIYLKELTSYLRKMQMINVDKQLSYYHKELEHSTDLALKDQLSKLASSLVQIKVLSKAKELYNVKQLTIAQVAYIKDKTKPKRGLIVVVAFITSIILAIFGVFFLEFLKSSDEDIN